MELDQPDDGDEASAHKVPLIAVAPIVGQACKVLNNQAMDLPESALKSYYKALVERLDDEVRRGYTVTGAFSRLAEERIYREFESRGSKKRRARDDSSESESSDSESSSSEEERPRSSRSSRKKKSKKKKKAAPRRDRSSGDKKGSEKDRPKKVTEKTDICMAWAKYAGAPSWID